MKMYTCAIIKASLRLERALGIIFDFITPRGLISHYGTKRPMKYTMLGQNKGCPRPRAHGGTPVLPSTFGCEEMFGSERRSESYVRKKHCE